MKKSAFEGMVDRAFLDLEAKDGFKRTETSYAEHSVTVRFQNATTELLLNYAIGETPWLEIADLRNTENRSTLGWLLVERGVEKAPTPAQAFRPTTLEDDQLEPALQKMGQQMRKYGPEFLRGDFGMMPKLQARARKYDKECQRYLAARKPKS
jgi:hypothetical protein